VIVRQGRERGEHQSNAGESKPCGGQCAAAVQRDSPGSHHMEISGGLCILAQTGRRNGRAKSMAVELLEKQATVDDVLREVARMKAAIADAVEDGVQSALRSVKQGKDAAQDAIHDARYAIKRNPLQAVGIVFAAGVVIGSFVAWISTRHD
jgi:ElaB/YqjD/DUF883 family membrane-anchored ribosome-binding protein